MASNVTRYYLFASLVWSHSHESQTVIVQGLLNQGTVP